MNKPVDDQLERELEQMFKEIPEPSARRDRALFVAGVAARKPKPVWQRALVPAMGVAIVFISLSVASLKAAPGQALWSVRNALNSVGIAPPVEIVNRSIKAAEADVERAEDALDRDDLDEADRLADRALVHVGEASGHLENLSGEQREEAVENIEDIREDVFGIREDIVEARLDLREERAEGAGSSSGSGSDDSDSSGKGSGSDDSSGSGSDDSGSDDSSGPGSDDTSSDDSSGPGSGDSGSDDSSGSGSGGSGSDDSSGEGSAGD